MNRISANELIHNISTCPNIAICLDSDRPDHPCNSIVRSQGAVSTEAFQVPEPWNGDIGNASILIISSNPSWDQVEEYPLASWDTSNVIDFFTNRFEGESRQWTDKFRPLLRNGSYKNTPTKFWSNVTQLAKELNPDAELGKNVAITEIVHCKSRDEKGVKEARQECAETWLDHVISVSDATVLVILGDHAQLAFSNLYGFVWQDDSRLFSQLSINGVDRHVVRMPHTNARVKRKFATVEEPSISLDELSRLRSALSD